MFLYNLKIIILILFLYAVFEWNFALMFYYVALDMAVENGNIQMVELLLTNKKILLNPFILK